MRIAHTNLIDAGTAPTALTTDLLYPVANLQNQRLAKRWRSQTPTAQTIVFDLGSAQAVDTLAVFSHNLSGSATVIVEAHTSDSWGTPALSAISLTYNSAAILKYLDSSETYRYWRYTLSDATNSDEYVEAGRIWLGTKLTLDPTSLDSFTVTKRRSDTVTHGRDQQKYAAQGVGWRSFELKFPRTAGTALTAIQTMYDTVGNHGSLIFSNFDDLRTFEIVEPVYCSIVGDIAFQHTQFMKFTYPLTLMEEL